MPVNRRGGSDAITHLSHAQKKKGDTTEKQLVEIIWKSPNSLPLKKDGGMEKLRDRGLCEEARAGVCRCVPMCADGL